MAQETEQAHEPRACDSALSTAFSFLGKRWNGVLLGTLANGPAGFADLRRSIGGISDSVLSERLTELTTAGLIQRAVSQTPPITVEYSLTDAGTALTPALNELTDWARKNLPAPKA